MNNYTPQGLESLNKTKSSKILMFFIKNRKLIKIWFILIFALLFTIGFSLFLYSGIGQAYDGKDNVLNGPSRNGVWYVQQFIGGTINGTTIHTWEDLASKFNDSYHQSYSSFLNMAVTLHDMYNTVLPIWIVGFVIIAIYFIFWLLWKFVFKKLIEKKLGNLIPNFNNENNQSIKDQNIDDLPDEIKNAIKEIEGNLNKDEQK